MGRLVGRSPWGWKSNKGDRDRALAALQAVDLATLAPRLLHELSGGQLQRALIARALAQGATLLLLDEPYVGLDEASRAALNQVLFGPALTGVTLLVATHDAMDIGKLDRVLTVKDHKVTVTHACEGGHLHRHA
jgi:ABC-type Mn2+/Zn2+ transport system ATPase subunit